MILVQYLKRGKLHLQYILYSTCSHDSPSFTLGCKLQHKSAIYNPT